MAETKRTISLVLSSITLIMGIIISIFGLLLWGQGGFSLRMVHFYDAITGFSSPYSGMPEFLIMFIGLVIMIISVSNILLTVKD